MHWNLITNKIEVEYPFVDKIFFSLEVGEDVFALPKLLKLGSFAAFDLMLNRISSKRLGIIFPNSESVAYLTGIITALQAILDQSGNQSVSLPDLNIGDKVLYRGGDYIYRGIRTINNVDLISLELKGKATINVPTDNRPFIQHNLSSRQLSTRSKSTKTDILDEILGTKLQGNTSLLSTSILLVSGIGETKEQAFKLKISSNSKGKNNRKKLIDTFGWSHLTSEGEIKIWGSSGKLEKPIITVASNLEVAEDFLEESDHNISLIIIDGATHLRNFSAFQSILDRNIPVLFLLSAKSVDGIKDLKENNFALWSWTKPELKHIHSDIDIKEHSPFFRLEKRFSSFSSFEINTECCLNSGLENTFKILNTIKRKINEDDYHALQIIEQLFITFTQITRTTSSSKEILQNFELKLSKIESEALGYRQFIEEETYSLISDAFNSLRLGLDKLSEEDSKPAQILKLLKNLSVNNKQIAVILGNTNFEETLVELKSKFRFAKSIVFEKSSNAKLKSSFDYVLLCGSLKRKYMLDIFDKATTSSLIVLTYPYEQGWIGTAKKQFFGITKDSSLRTYTGFLQNVEGNSLQEVEKEEVANSEEILEPDEFQLKINEIKNRRILKTIANFDESQKVAARSVIFNHNYLAFLTENYSVPVVSGLIGSSKHNDEIPHKKISEIQIGDLLLFRENSSQNLIRDMADIGLKNSGKAGARITAGRWRSTLKAIYTESNNNLHVVKEKLAEYGCKRNIHTIKNWIFNENLIAPRNEEDIDAITVAAGDDDLDQRAAEIRSAVRQVRSAHIQAAHAIVKKLESVIAQNLADLDDTNLVIEIEGLGRVHLVNVEVIYNQEEQIPIHKVNKLLNMNEII